MASSIYITDHRKKSSTILPVVISGIPLEFGKFHIVIALTDFSHYSLLSGFSSTIYFTTITSGSFVKRTCVRPINDLTGFFLDLLEMIFYLVFVILPPTILMEKVRAQGFIRVFFRTNPIPRRFISVAIAEVFIFDSHLVMRTYT